MRVKDVMTEKVKTVGPDKTVKEAAKEMERYKIGSLIVTDGYGRILGIISERDIIGKAVASDKNSNEIKVKEIMKEKVISVTKEETLESAANIMIEKGIKTLPVVEGGVVTGIVTATDLISSEKHLLERVLKFVRERKRRLVNN